MATRVDIYDTTLRDGTQGEGFSLSLQDKLQIAYKLDELGIDYIEGGFPVSNPKDEAFFREIAAKPPKRARVSAFGMTRRRGVAAKDDTTLAALLAAETPMVTIVGKTSPYQVQTVMNVTLEENLAMIADSVRLLREAGRTVVYDAEHFFDTFKADADYAIATLRAAEQAGANVLCLCDTNGGSMPEHIAAAVQRVKRETSATIGIHTHNDCGLAVANAQAAVAAGASHVQGTMNGVGERCGNMDLIPLVANLKFKYGIDCLRPEKFECLTEVSRFVYETANFNPVSGQPYVGTSAFAHKGGMHVHAVQKDPSTYEHVSPESVGNSRKFLVSELSGASNIAEMARKFGVDKDRDTLRAVLGKVQDLENAGYQFEAAEASFELLLRKQIGRHHSFFDLQKYRVTTSRHESGEVVAEASVKLTVDGVLEHRVSEGNGPVDSFDRALRKALKEKYPAIQDLHLSDYKVRVVNTSAETAAVVRVVIDWKHKTTPGGAVTHFGTIGVSGNVIDATWHALCDAFEYHLLLVEEAAAKTTAEVAQ
ncbi:MAG: cimA [Phycisphaerales bacterium]|nr:cimA [Phycisphaerales bacterium]